MGEPQRALQCLDAAIDLMKRNGKNENLGFSYLNGSAVLSVMRENEKAKKYAELAIESIKAEIKREKAKGNQKKVLERRSLLGFGYFKLAVQEMKLGSVEEANRNYLQAQKLIENNPETSRTIKRAIENGLASGNSRNAFKQNKSSYSAQRSKPEQSKSPLMMHGPQSNCESSITLSAVGKTMQDNREAMSSKSLKNESLSNSTKSVKVPTKAPTAQFSGSTSPKYAVHRAGRNKHKAVGKEAMVFAHRERIYRPAGVEDEEKLSESIEEQQRLWKEGFLDWEDRKGSKSVKIYGKGLRNLSEDKRMSNGCRPVVVTKIKRIDSSEAATSNLLKEKVVRKEDLREERKRLERANDQEEDCLKSTEESPLSPEKTKNVRRVSGNLVLVDKKDLKEKRKAKKSTILIKEVLNEEKKTEIKSDTKTEKYSEQVKTKQKENDLGNAGKVSERAIPIESLDIDLCKVIKIQHWYKRILFQDFANFNLKLVYRVIARRNAKVKVVERPNENNYKEIRARILLLQRSKLGDIELYVLNLESNKIYKANFEFSEGFPAEHVKLLKQSVTVCCCPASSI
eukprot:TRINITY_DN7198_c0_g5_i1.p1 TRINITY_DN7198_c0_g5~~TRINITY_DN7198_c0_g5_i1.p1  ORF type:complete len:570 (+),score=152.47 TRINITY_DN7198_c0_g5_i1:462-2171(+)